MPRRPGERSFFFAGTCSSRSLRFSAKSAAWSWPLPLCKESATTVITPPQRRAGLGNALFLCMTCNSRPLHYPSQKRLMALLLHQRRIIAGAPSSCAQLRCKERTVPRTQRKRAPAIWQGPLKMGKEKAGTYLFSQVVSNQVSSALRSLTSVFGMGTGGTSA